MKLRSFSLYPFNEGFFRAFQLVQKEYIWQLSSKIKRKKEMKGSLLCWWFIKFIPMNLSSSAKIKQRNLGAACDEFQTKSLGNSVPVCYEGRLLAQCYTSHCHLLCDRYNRTEEALEGKHQITNFSHNLYLYLQIVPGQLCSSHINFIFLHSKSAI